MAEPESTVINTHVKQKDPSEALVIAVTTRAIFDLEEEHKLYLEKGKEEYTRHQQANQDKLLPPGTAFAFIQAAQYVNEKILESNPAEKNLFDILVLSNNSPESGVRIVNSAKHYGLEISKFCFVSDEDSTQYLKSHSVKLFLSADRTDVCNALQRGVSAALVFQQDVQAPSTPLRVVFDGDAVLFSDETDQVFREQGLEGAVQYERAMEAVPMGEGPLKAFAMHLGKIRKKFSQEESPIRTYLVTARSGRDMGIRAIKTLREWGLAIDEAFFMDGAPKGPILAQIQPHIFFDDGLHNIHGAQDVGVPSAWVPSCC
ncbi:cytosolic 5'-nucleotidase 1A [Columba livia]|uniref:Cytosolic 5'-nucleotidase 1A n=1 Tax=Columba livia TaxID=8932 RepID=A0A2I0MHW5_COLLI|nr:cytosolic 5'-nucleotidase 1A [Columba livia]XP_021155155.1 cytosolic 5'-nucleotidase 1A [Columba livia]XP_021155163.1 cytosolic 5'-nucleotidase 1A [Columba livia]XP_021155172.1 cytosolic 5'-nucleotidase 1A [Columba livia]KAK2519750.1 cytosolic 5'-nucleotidase 1A [Columba livia]PKK29272.1 cytosolic 5'-nucleotidase 1A [Columba livia]